MPLPGSPLFLTTDQFEDDNGDPLAGGLLYTYEAGTATPLALYTDEDLTVPAANPVELDASGRPATNLYMLPQGYKLVLADADDNLIATADDVSDPAYVVFDTLANVLADGSRDVEDQYQITDEDNTVTVLPAADPTEVFLPAADTRGFPLTVINLSTSIDVTLTPDGSDTINGQSGSLTLPAGSSPVFSGVTLNSDGVSNWLMSAYWS